MQECEGLNAAEGLRVQQSTKKSFLQLILKDARVTLAPAEEHRVLCTGGIWWVFFLKLLTLSVKWWLKKKKKALKHSCF